MARAFTKCGVNGVSSLALTRLLQLASPALPVGAYTYSQGLEFAADDGRVRDEASTQAWIGDLLQWNLARCEAPWLTTMLRAWAAGDQATLLRINADFIASRESAELRAETLQMGHSLKRLLADLPDFPPAVLALLTAQPETSFPLAWSGAAHSYAVSIEDALVAYLWAWAENQVMAAIKAVPLGQTAGQRILLALGERIPALAREAAATDESAIFNFAPAFAITCSQHENQYSRLFRS